MNVSQYVWHRLSEWGLKRVYGYPGDKFMRRVLEAVDATDIWIHDDDTLARRGELETGSRRSIHRRSMEVQRS